MNLSKKSIDGAVVITVSGDLDLDSSPELRTVLKPLAATRKALLIIDLAGVSFIDSSGVATVIRSLMDARRGGGSVGIVGADGHVRDVFRLAGVHELLPMYSTVEEALGS